MILEEVSGGEHLPQFDHVHVVNLLPGVHACSPILGTNRSFQVQSARGRREARHEDASQLLARCVQDVQSARGRREARHGGVQAGAKK